MQFKKGACLVCGGSLRYFDTPIQMECSFCHKKFESYASCEHDHYICDACHSQKGIDAIIEHCSHTKSKNPIEILKEIMADPFIYMHGPEHHIMVGASLLTAYKNSGGDIELSDALAEMKSRGSNYPGGSCGYWSCCGAAVSVGMFFSIITKSTPLSTDTWGMGNRITAKCLQAIGDIGGPRCCKRNSFTAIKNAVEFVEKNLSIKMEMPTVIKCSHSSRNKECLGKRCPYN